MKDIEVANELKILALEMINNAGSGHSGSVLSCGDALFVLYTRHLLRDKSNDMCRDRFVLSNGHACAILYSILAGLEYFDFEEVKKFRQYNGLLSGHPELGIPGIDCGTGPLGQGVANAVGMAIAETIMNEKYGINHYTYCMCGDGCLEEGVALEALSVAGLYNLNKFILLYDKNNVTLDGKLSISSRDDVTLKFKSMNFNVLECDGHNLERIDKTIIKAKLSKNEPTVIILNTKIGKDTEFENSHLSHGKVYTTEEIKKLKNKYKINNNYLEISQDCKNYLLEKNKLIIQKFAEKQAKTKEKIENNKKLLNNYKKIIKNEFKYKIKLNKNNISTRLANSLVLNQIAESVENIICLSADLSSSTKVRINNGGDYSSTNRLGRNISVGIREHAMGAIANGMALHGGVIPIVSTFLTFSNYMMPAIRMASIMKLPVMFCFTHSSIYDTPDGVTHLPVEQLDQLRLIPNMTVACPSCMGECVTCYDWFLSERMPICVSLSRGDITYHETMIEAQHGAYYLTDEKSDIVIMASGSEVGIAMEVKELLASEIKVNVVSVLSMEIFDKQTKAYKNKILKNKIFVIESSTAVKYLKYTDEECIFNVTDFGATGDESNLKKRHDLTAEIIAKKIKKILE